MTVYAYCRVSTAEQGASGLGLEAQRISIEWTAQRHGGIERWFEDVASGGGVAKRPGFQAMIGELRHGDALYVSQLDRLTRDLGYFVSDLVPMFDKLGIVLVVGGQEVHDFRNPDQVGSVLYNMVGAYVERLRASYRTRLALAAKREREPGSLDRPDRRTDPAAVARAVELRHGGATLRQIGQALTDEGYQTAQNGKEWYPGTVRYLLAKAT